MTLGRPLAAALAALLWLAPEPPAAADRVLATADGHRLTESMAADAEAFAAFLAGEPLTPAERRTLEADLVESFAVDPVGESRGLRQLREIVANVEGLSPADAAARRARLVRQLHWAYDGKPKALLIELVERHDPVLGTDPATRAVVTRSAVRALAASNSFVAEMAGFAPMTPDEVAALEAQVPAALPGMKPEVQRLLGEAEARWERLRARWAEIAEKDRETVRAAVRAGLDSRDEVPDVARALEQIVENRHLAAVNTASLRAFMQAGAMMTLPSVMLQQAGSFN